MMTFNELSDLEISQSQIQVDGQSELDRHSFGKNMQNADYRQRREAQEQQADDSDANGAHMQYNQYNPTESYRRR